MAQRTVLWFFLCLLVAGHLSGPSPAASQEVAGDRAGGPAVAVADSDDARRATVLEVLGRPEVRNTALVAGIDLNEVAAGIERLQGEPLARAARQAEDLDRRLAIDGTISSTTLIILLVLTILLIVLLQS